MIYKIEQGKLKIINTVNMFGYTVDVSFLNRISSLSIDRSQVYLAVSGQTIENGKQELYIGRLETGELNKVYSGKADDLTWQADDQNLMFNSGNTICRISANGENLEKLYKFSNISYSPILLSLNPGGTKLACTKWDGRDRKICVFDLMDKRDIGTMVTCSYYSWLDDRRVIYSHGGRIIILDVDAEKTTTFLKDARTLGRKPSFRFACGELSRFLQRANPVSIKEVGEPKYFQGRIFFKVFLANGQFAKSAILSTTSNLTDWRQHSITDKGYIKSYSLLNQGNTVAVNINYPLESKPSRDELLYYKDSQETVYNGYHPIPNTTFPTAFLSIKVN
ncbi:MAG: TolB family protein [Bacillota bacterium]